jgi:hypothetical protein
VPSKVLLERQQDWFELSPGHNYPLTKNTIYCWSYITEVTNTTNAHKLDIIHILLISSHLAFLVCLLLSAASVVAVGSSSSSYTLLYSDAKACAALVKNTVHCISCFRNTSATRQIRAAMSPIQACEVNVKFTIFCATEGNLSLYLSYISPMLNNPLWMFSATEKWHGHTH